MDKETGTDQNSGVDSTKPGREVETTNGPARPESLLELLKESIRTALANDPFFKQAVQEAGVEPDDINSLEDISILPVSRGALRRRDPEAPDGWQAALKAAGFRSGQGVLSVMWRDQGWWNITLDKALSDLGIKAIPAGMAEAEVQLGLCKDLKLEGVIAAPKNLEADGMLNRIIESRMQGDQYPETVLLIMDMLTGEPCQIPENLAGIRVFRALGFPAWGCVAYECESTAGFHACDHVIMEVVDPLINQPVSPGEVGRVLVTVLGGDRPVIRRSTGYLASFSDEPCACGLILRRIMPSGF